MGDPAGAGVDRDVAPDSLCLVRRERPGNCSCEHSAAVRSSTRDARLRPGLGGYACGRTAAGSGVGGIQVPMDPLLAPLHISSASSSSFGASATGASSNSRGGAGSGRSTSGGREEGGARGLTGGAPGLSLEELLPRVTDRHRTVVLVAVVGGYAELAMSFVCM